MSDNAKTYHARTDSGELLEYDFSMILTQCYECKIVLTREEYAYGHDCEA
jgi:hypothetical protein